MNSKLFLMFLAVSLAVLISSCGKLADDNTIDEEMTYEERSSEAMTDENDFWSSDRDYTFAQRDEFKEDVNAAIEKLNTKINELEEHAYNAAGDTKEWYNDRIEDLKEKRSEIENDMQRFDNITADAWYEFKTAITSVWNEIEESWNNIAADDRMIKDRQY